MPTYAWLARFRADFERLTPTQQAAFLVAVEQFVEDLRVKGIQGATGIFEMTWAPNGKATFEYGASGTEGQPHVIWRRVGQSAGGS